MRLDAGRIDGERKMWTESMLLRRYMGGTIGGFYLVILRRWFLYVDWIR